MNARRPGTVDESPRLAMNQKAAIVASAAATVRTRLAAEYGGRGDLQTLARLTDVYPPALAMLYDAIRAAD